MSNLKQTPAAHTSCRGCGVPLTSKNDSEAHIIPNALGGRLKPKGIICRTCNTKLDDIADYALIKAFGDWPTLLDIPRDRGSHPHKIIETQNGRRVRVEPNGKLTAVDVQYLVEPSEDGHKIEIAAGDMKTFRQLLKRAEKQFPQVNAKEAENYARTVGVEDGDLLIMSLDFSPVAVFGGVVTATWLYLIMKTDRAFMSWERLIEVIRSMQEHGGSFRYLIDGLPGLKGPDIPLNHKIIIRSVPCTGQMIVYVEILGMLKIGGIFADAGGPTDLYEYIYVYDLLGKADRSAEFRIDANEFERQNWKAIGLSPSDAQALRAHFERQIELIFIRHYSKRFSSESL